MNFSGVAERARIIGCFVTLFLLWGVTVLLTFTADENSTTVLPYAHYRTLIGSHTLRVDWCHNIIF